jgi:hypothetical protein
MYKLTLSFKDKHLSYKDDKHIYGLVEAEYTVELTSSQTALPFCVAK